MWYFNIKHNSKLLFQSFASIGRVDLVILILYQVKHTYWCTHVFPNDLHNLGYIYKYFCTMIDTVITIQSSDIDSRSQYFVTWMEHPSLKLT